MPEYVAVLSVRGQRLVDLMCITTHVAELGLKTTFYIQLCDMETQMHSNPLTRHVGSLEEIKGV